MEQNEIINSGCLKFKAGLVNKWLTGYCVLQKGVFRIYKQQEANSDLLYVFTNTKSWISAKRGVQNSLFVVNATESNSTSSKIFLFDTEDAELLHVWLHGFKMAGWSSAIAGDKFHYHRRSIDIEGDKHADSTLKDGRRTSDPAYFVTGRRSSSRPQSGERDRHCQADPDLSLSRRWESSRSYRTANAESNVDDKSETPKFHGGKMRIYHSERMRKSGEMVGRRSEIVERTGEKLKNGLELVKQVNGSLGRSNSERVANHHTVKEFHSTKNELGNVKRETGMVISNDRLARHNSAKVVRVTAMEVEVTRNVRSCSLRSDLRTEEQNALKDGGKRPPFELHTVSDEYEERRSSKPIPIQGNKRISREGRFDYSKIFYDPALSPDLKGILVKPENNTRKTSLVRQVTQSQPSPSEEIPNPLLQSPGADEGDEKRCSDDAKSETKASEKLRSLTDSSYASLSPPPQDIEITSIDTGEKETLNNITRTRKCSSIASEGVADMNLDVDADTPVFSTGTQGTRFTYSESGYCSKESLATNESSDVPRSPPPTPNEVNNNINNNNNNNNNSIKEVEVKSKENDSRIETEDEEKDSTGLAHSSLKGTSDENKTGLALNEAAGIAETGRTYSDPAKTMTRNFGRPAMLKIEKRSSMTQLLSQIKDKLPGRKNKVARKNTQKDQASADKPELILWSNAGKWKERFFTFQHNCLLLFKNADFKSPDFALDVRGCSLEIPIENSEQGFLSFKLFERNGNKDHTFAAVTEDSYNELLSMLHKMGQIGRQSDSEIGLTSDPDEMDGMDTEEIAFQDAIVPYSDSEHFAEDNLIIPEKPNKKQASIDSGNDGDTSCFETSDASNAGIDSYAAGWKDKKMRQRKTSMVLQQPVIDPLQESVNETSETDEKGPVASVRRSHRKITHSQSSPPSPRHVTRTFSKSAEWLKSDSTKLLSPIDYLNVDGNVTKRSPKNRYSAPDFQKRQSLNLCLEEVSRLKEAHENNVYPAMNGKNGKGRTLSLYVMKTKATFVDENANHQQSEHWDRVVTSSPKKIVDNSVILGTKQSAPRPVSGVIAKGRPRSTNSSNRLSLSLNLPSSSTSLINMLASPTESSEFVEEISEDEMRQQTLLMKRRNSLKLQKDVVARKVKGLKERLAKNSVESSDLESTDEERNLSVLENRISRIDAELTEINIKVISPEDIFKENKKKTKQLFSKFKSGQKSSQHSGIDKTNIVTKDSLDVLLTSPSISPRVRKRSLFGQSSKRNSDVSEPDSNRASLSSIDSSTDITDGASAGRRAESLTDLKSADDMRGDVERVRKANSVRSVPEKIDEVDCDRDFDRDFGLKQDATSLQDVNEKGISKEALLRIEEFEQFAVEMTAKRFTDCIDV